MKFKVRLDKEYDCNFMERTPAGKLKCRNSDGDECLGGVQLDACCFGCKELRNCGYPCGVMGQAMVDLEPTFPKEQ